MTSYVQMPWVALCLMACVVLMVTSGAESRSRANRLYDPAPGLRGPRQGVLGMRGLNPDQVYRFCSEPAQRVLVS